MTSIVIGHTSMLGLSLKRLLDEIGESYITVGRSANSDIQLDFCVQPPDPTYICESIGNVETIYVLTGSFEGDSAEGTNKNILINSASAAHVIYLAESTKPRAIIYSGSVSSYDKFDISRGLSSYGLTKRIAEELLEWWAIKARIRFASVRLSQLFDDIGMCISHQPWIGRIIRYAFEKEDLYLPSSDGRRNFLHVDDAAKLLLEVGKNSLLSGVLNGCSPHQYSYEDLARIAFSFNQCMDKLHVIDEKESFRPICLPEVKLLYESLQQEPMITPHHWIKRIAARKSWPSFGPMDVEGS